MSHDLATPAAKLAAAFKAFELSWKLTSVKWNDDTSRAFEDKYLKPLRQDIQLALDSTQQVAELCTRAERECT
ncbi:MAG: hypothetical protein N2C12_03775 [Planctomycetales bacterium]